MNLKRQLDVAQPNRKLVLNTQAVAYKSIIIPCIYQKVPEASAVNARERQSERRAQRRKEKNIRDQNQRNKQRIATKEGKQARKKTQSNKQRNT
jgi:hypothetical protein